MSGFPWRFVSILVILIAAFSAWVPVSSAQADYLATLSAIDTSNFPHLAAYLDVHDAAGGFMHGLTVQDIMMQENGEPVPVTQLEEQRPGIQIVIAITPGASFTIRDSLGKTRYDYFLKGLLAGDWESLPPGVDDFSLMTMEGPQLTHSSSPLALHSAIAAYQPDDPNATPNLEVLSAALQVAADPTSRPGMERAILFITPPLETDVSLGLQSIVASASQQDVRIFVWLLAAAEVFDLPATGQLRDLAGQTHASFFAFSHDEPVPDLDTLLEPLRYVYQLGYDSRASTSGPQQVSALITDDGGQITSTVQSFNVDLKAPLPVIINPPTEIVRKFTLQPTQAKINLGGDLLPSEQVLNIEVAFPDGHERPINLTRLYVDGVVAAENTNPPFNRFLWDLRPYTQEGVHTLRVEATDNLGWVGTSTEITIKIVVPTTTQGVLVAVTHKKPLIVGVTVIVSASILVLVLIIGGRIRPKPHPGQVILPPGSTDKTRPRGYRARMRQRRDPVTQPVNINGTSGQRRATSLRGWINRLPWFTRSEKPAPALAYLVPLVGADDPTIPAPLTIYGADYTLGSDPHQASLAIMDPSVEPLHAKIQHAGKTFIINDASSVAGTWVNYEQVAAQGRILMHMDIIHLGSIGFCFKLAEPGPLPEVVVTPLEPKM